MSKQAKVSAGAKTGITDAREHLSKVESAVGKAVKADPRFNKQAPGASYQCSPYVCGVTTHDDDTHQRSAVVSTPDGKLVKHPFDYDEDTGEVTLADGDPQETERSTVYSKAITDFRADEKVQAAGNSAGAGKGQANRKSTSAAAASAAAHEASTTAMDSGDDADHATAREMHGAASAAHESAMLAQAKAGDKEKAKDHAKAMLAHDACADAHCRDGEPDADDMKAAVAACAELAGIDCKEPIVTASFEGVVHCRASGSKLPETKWVAGQPVDFCYMPGGVHTICAGFSGSITKGRPSSIDLTVDVEPETDAPVCQASLERLVADAPKQEPYGCFEHEEKQASVRAENVTDGIFKAGKDPVYGEPCILAHVAPSESGAKAVNGKDWRSWSPSFRTDAAYAKCMCGRCEETIKACDCVKPAFYFPDGVRGSESNPAKITGVDFVLGTLTNKPAFRAMPPVKAKHEGDVIKSSDEDEKCEMPEPPSDGIVGKEHANSQSMTRKAMFKSKVAEAADETLPEGEGHGTKQNTHREAAYAHMDAGNKSKNPKLKQFHKDAADYHIQQAGEHSKVTSSSEPSTETILAACTRQPSVDEILASMEPGKAGHRQSIGEELDALDEIMKACSPAA